jgi:DNA-binding response OmpR family regulator
MRAPSSPTGRAATTFEGYERTVDAHVKNLRRKIEKEPLHPRSVETVRGVGYLRCAQPS